MFSFDFILADAMAQIVAERDMLPFDFILAAVMTQQTADEYRPSMAAHTELYVPSPTKATNIKPALPTIISPRDAIAPQNAALIPKELVIDMVDPPNLLRIARAERARKATKFFGAELRTQPANEPERQKWIKRKRDTATNAGIEEQESAPPAKKKAARATLVANTVPLVLETGELGGKDPKRKVEGRNARYGSASKTSKVAQNKARKGGK